MPRQQPATFTATEPRADENIVGFFSASKTTTKRFYLTRLALKTLLLVVLCRLDRHNEQTYEGEYETVFLGEH